MLKFRNICILLMLLFSSATSAALQMSIGIGLPNVSIGINVPAYPEFVIVPGFPVYYAPRMEANFFFYDGLYWVYQNDNWYESSWYNGPWWLVDPDEVPLYILRVPVRYYGMPPAYFIGWQFDAPPRWGDHWGRDWDQRRSGWNRWGYGTSPAAAPLPVYQRQYSGDRYPKQVEQQRNLHQQNYHFQPLDPVVRKQYQEQAVPRTPAQQEKIPQNRKEAPDNRGFKKQGNQRIESSKPESPQQTTPPSQDKPEMQRDQSTRNGSENFQRSTPVIPQERPKGQEPRQPPQGVEPRSQSPQNGGVKVEKLTPAATQQGRTEAQSPRQQSGQGTLQREQQNQKAIRKNNNTPSEPNHEQKPERNKDRNE